MTIAKTIFDTVFCAAATVAIVAVAVLLVVLAISIIKETIEDW